jgi:hypothetical protein
VILCFTSVAAAFVLVVVVPIFFDFIGITAALFAAWFTYGIAGFFWLHVYYIEGGMPALKRRPVSTVLAFIWHS